MKGCYILLIKLDKDLSIDIGKLGNIDFKKGFYVYVGSAMNNLEPRIERHLIKEKKFHWHIDYLLEKAKIINVYCKEGNIREECKIAKTLNQHISFIPNFGCSDCLCKSHLFYGDINKIQDLISNLEMINF